MIYSDRRTPSELQIELTRAEIVPDGQRLRVDLDGSLNSQPLRMTGSTATLAQLIAAEGSVPIDLSGVALGLKIEAKGELAYPEAGVAMSATFGVAGDSLAGLRPWIGDVLADGGPVRASVALQGVGQTIDISRLDIELGKRRLQGKMSASFAEVGTVRVRDGALGYTDGRSGKSWKAEIASASVTPGEDALRFDFDGKVDGQAIRLRGKTAALPALAASKASIPVELSGDVLGLRVDAKGKLADPKTGAAMDATLSVAGKSLAGLRPWVGDALAGLGSVKAKLTAKGGGNAYRLAPFDLVVGKGRFDGIQGDKLMIAPLVAGTVVGGMIEGDMDLSLDARAAGRSSAELARSLSGKLLVLIEQAQADLTHLNRLTPGVRDLLGQLAKPNRKLARVNCGVAAFEFQGGRTQVRSLVDTPDSTTVAHGSIDFGAETLEVRVVPDAKGVNLKVPVPIVVQGSLARPDYRVGKGVLLLSLTDLATKIALPQVLLVDAFGAGIAGNPCVKMATGSVERSMAAPVEALTAPVGQALKATTAVVEGAGKVVKEAGGAVVQGAGGLLKGVGRAVGGLLGGGRQETDVEQGEP